MVHRQLLTVVVVVVAISVPARADHANSAFKRGTRAEAHADYDAASEAYKEAHNLKPKDAKYLAGYVRMRFMAAAEHIHTGQTPRNDGNTSPSPN